MIDHVMFIKCELNNGACLRLHGRNQMVSTPQEILTFS